MSASIRIAGLWSSEYGDYNEFSISMKCDSSKIADAVKESVVKKYPDAGGVCDGVSFTVFVQDGGEEVAVYKGRWDGVFEIHESRHVR